MRTPNYKIAFTQQVTKSLCVLAVFGCPWVASYAQGAVHTWSAQDSATCESTIMNPGWYSDGSGLFTEVMQVGDGTVTAALTLLNNNLVLAVGFGTSTPGKTLTVIPSDVVSIHSNSTANLILRSLNGPSEKFPKNDVTVKKQIKHGAQFTVTDGHIAAGYMFFPNDIDGTQFTVLVDFAGSTYAFPFRRSPNFKAKFVALDSDTKSSLSVNAPKTEVLSQPIAVSPTNIPAQGESSGNLQLVAAQNKTSAPKTPSVAHSTGACGKTIAFGSFENGRFIPAEPGYIEKWVKKNQQKYPSLCFSESPSSDKESYLFVFANSQSSFNGFYPTTRTNTSTSTNPTYGSGIVTDNYGNTWNYNYSGAVTTTTITTSQVNLAYTDTENSLYCYVYDANGNLVSRHSRSVTTRQGGDGMNTLGYNLGATLGAIHMKENLLKEAVDSVQKMK